MPLANFGVQTDEIYFLPDLKSNKCNTPHSQNLSTSLSPTNLLSGNKHKSYMSRRLRKWLCLLLFTITFGFLGMLYIEYINPNYSIHLFVSPKISSTPKVGEDLPSKITNIGKFMTAPTKYNNIPSFNDVLSKDFQFNIEGHDVMVFLHIQKTGGTAFGKHLVKDLELARECVCHRKVKKRCTCLRPGVNSDETWLFSRYSTGWRCGLHADWTELTSCVDDAMDKIEDSSVKRRYFYITILRDPILRYLSEFRHVQRGATWKRALLFCNGRSATKEEVPPCYEGDTWENVTLEKFVSCQSNLANNRQTRMLADLTLADCYERGKWTKTQRETILLASAKNNLERMIFVGMTEFQEISQYIFEETFNLKFNVRFAQKNLTKINIDEQLMARIVEINRLDLELYEYAKNLLFSRFKKLKKLDNQFDEHFNGMGHAHFSWDKFDKDR